MKATLLFATLTMVFAAPQTYAATELEALRERCARQEQEIRKLSEQVRRLQPESSDGTAIDKTTAPSGSSYTVRSGDSLERIARRSGCTAASLIKANGLKSDSVIHPGQKLTLPGRPAAVQATAATPPVKRATATTVTAQATTSSHKVAEGETFASISRKYRVSLNSLLAANPDVKPTSLRPGQVIRLSSESPASRPSPAVASKSAPAIADAAPAPKRTRQTPTPTTIPISTRETTPAPAPAPQPAVSAPSTANPPAAAAASSLPAAATPEKPVQESTAPSTAEKKIRAVTIEGEMSYGEFAAKHGTDTERLNDLNGLDLTHATVLAKGSELYVPAQP